MPADRLTRLLRHASDRVRPPGRWPPAGPTAARRAVPPAPSPPAPARVQPDKVRCRAAATTAAAAVVLAPLASNITETRMGPKNVCVTCSSNASPSCTFVPPMKDGGGLEIVGPAREHRSVNQPRHVLGPDSAILKQMIHLAIDRHDRVEHAGMTIGIELNQNSRFRHRPPPSSADLRPQGERSERSSSARSRCPTGQGTLTLGRVTEDAVKRAGPQLRPRQSLWNRARQNAHRSAGPSGRAWSGETRTVA